MFPASGAAARASLFVLLALVIAACTVRVTGANTVQEFAAEDHYRAAYHQGIAALQADLLAFAPTATSPGVCNKGGSKQGCYDGDLVVVADLKQLLALLGNLTVPP